jgi:hypothetical protein
MVIDIFWAWVRFLTIIVTVAIHAQSQPVHWQQLKNTSNSALPTELFRFYQSPSSAPTPDTIIYVPSNSKTKQESRGTKAFIIFSALILFSSFTTIFTIKKCRRQHDQNLTGSELYDIESIVSCNISRAAHNHWKENQLSQDEKDCHTSTDSTETENSNEYCAESKQKVLSYGQPQLKSDCSEVVSSSFWHADVLVSSSDSSHDNFDELWDGSNVEASDCRCNDDDTCSHFGPNDIDNGCKVHDKDCHTSTDSTETENSNEYCAESKQKGLSYGQPQLKSDCSEVVSSSFWHADVLASSSDSSHDNFDELWDGSNDESNVKASDCRRNDDDSCSHYGPIDIDDGCKVHDVYPTIQCHESQCRIKNRRHGKYKKVSAYKRSQPRTVQGVRAVYIQQKSSYRSRLDPIPEINLGDDDTGRVSISVKSNRTHHQSSKRTKPKHYMYL